MYRVKEGGQPPMEAIISATCRAVEALRLDREVGSTAPGMQPDLIATAGNPIDDINAYAA